MYKQKKMPLPYSERQGRCIAVYWYALYRKVTISLRVQP